MTEESPLEDFDSFISYFRGFIDLMESFAEGFNEEEVFDLEASCRNIVYHTDVILKVILAGRNEISQEESLPLPEGKPKLTLVQKSETKEFIKEITKK